MRWPRSARSDDASPAGRAPRGDRLRDVRRDLVLAGPPQPVRNPRVRPVDRGPGLAQRRYLAGALRSSREGGGGQPLPGHGQRRAEAQHHHRPHPVGQARRSEPAEPPGDQRVRVVGFLPREHVQAEGAARRGLRRGQFQPRHHQERVASGRHRQAGQPF